MSFLAIYETKHDYVDVDLIEAMECINLQDYSFKLPREESRNAAETRGQMRRGGMLSFKPLRDLYLSFESEPRPETAIDANVLRSTNNT